MSANAASLSATYPSLDTATGAFTWGRYARTGLLTIGAAVLANALLLYLAQVAVRYDPVFLPLGNVSNAEIAVLVMMHVVAAAIITRGLTSIRR